MPEELDAVLTRLGDIIDPMQRARAAQAAIRALLDVRDLAISQAWAIRAAGEGLPSFADTLGVTRATILSAIGRGGQL